MSRKHLFTFRDGFMALPILLRSPYRRAFLLCLRGAWRGYFAPQFRTGRARPVDLPTDHALPLDPDRVGVYLSFIPLGLATVRYLDRELPDRRDELAAWIEKLAKRYSEAGEVYREAQTTFPRRRRGRLRLSLLRMIDRPRNGFPSMHAVFVGHIYGHAEQVLRGRSDPDKYADFRRALLRQIIAILESCYLLEQHGSLDIAGGLALLTVSDSSFTRAHATDLIQGLFREHPLVPPAVGEGVRTETSRVYQELLDCFAVAPNKTPPETLVEYLRGTLSPSFSKEG